nr:hypothetical protein [Luteibacter rhizovicinus]
MRTLVVFLLLATVAATGASAASDHQAENSPPASAKATEVPCEGATSPVPGIDARGDIDSDGHDEVAAVTYCGAGDDMEIVVSKRDSDGVKRVIAATGTWGRDNLRRDQISLQRGSLTYSTNCNGSCGEQSWSEDFTFRFERKALVLVSIEQSWMNSDGSAYGTRINLLKGYAIHFRKKGSREVERRTTFKPATLSFNAFSLDTMHDVIDSTLGMHGYVDEHFHFREQ